MERAKHYIIWVVTAIAVMAGGLLVYQKIVAAGCKSNCQKPAPKKPAPKKPAPKKPVLPHGHRGSPM